jgi:large subunit ribosomal protein L30e
MPISSELEKQLKVSARTGKYIVGRKEVLASLKGSKLLVWSSSANISQELLNQCKSLQIPALRFDGDPIALGKTCGIPFKVSVIAVRSAGDADLENFLRAQDYSVPKSSTLPVPITSQELRSEVPEQIVELKDSEEPKDLVKTKDKKVKEGAEKEKPAKKVKKSSKSSSVKKPKAKKTK